ncbi:MAG: hypothetical protein ACKOE6_16595 [Flammeovirgaceae bacterium]
MTQQNKDTLNIVLLSAYFFVPFYGLRIALERYLGNDRLDIAYIGLLGLFSGLIVSISIIALKTTKTKIVGLVILLFLVVAISLIAK